MSSEPLFLRALPAYLGGKRRLCPLLFGLLNEAIERERWRGMTFLDPFLGGGSVSLWAKASGFRVVCNDLALRSAVVGGGLIANGSVRLTQADVAAVLREPRESYPRLAEQEFCPGVFSRDHSQLIDQVLHWLRAGHISEPRRSLLTLLLVKWILRLQPMSMLRGTDARAAAGEDYDRVSPRRVGHYLRSQELLAPAAWWELAREVNLGVFAGEGEAHQQDVFNFLNDAQGDIIYVDAPYPGTTCYEKEYAVLDHLLEGREYERSDFSGAAPPLDELFRACKRIPVWLVSLGNAVIGKEELVNLISRHRDIRRVLEIPYRHLESIASEEKNAKNKEYLILATC
jgi:adenine-specific DNA methylase